MDKKQKLVGIDLVRGLAIYAVVILHSDEGILVPPVGWSAIAQFSSFAVPFFLATSFYLVVNKIYTSGTQNSWKSRLKRLLIPYLFWSAVYLFQKSIKYLIKSDFNQLSHVFSDPVALIFFGDAAIHLYFLPLLFAGTIFIVKFAHGLIKKQNFFSLVLLLIASIVLYEYLIISGNSFQLDSKAGFQQLLASVWSAGNQNPTIRICLGELALLIRCLPYILMAMVLNHPSIKKNLKFSLSSTSFLFIVFIVVNLFGSPFLPIAIYEITRGYAALLLAISCSTNFKENRIIASLGSCSFGIYLLHLLVVEVFQSLEKRVYAITGIQTSILTLLLFSVFTFLVSWLATHLLMRKKSISKLMFGL